MTYPWVTKTEAQQAADRAGCRAIFHDTEAAAVAADAAQRRKEPLQSVDHTIAATH